MKAGTKHARDKTTKREESEKISKRHEGAGIGITKQFKSRRSLLRSTDELAGDVAQLGRHFVFQNRTDDILQLCTRAEQQFRVWQTRESFAEYRKLVTISMLGGSPGVGKTTLARRAFYVMGTALDVIDPQTTDSAVIDRPSATNEPRVLRERIVKTEGEGAPVSMLREDVTFLRTSAEKFSPEFQQRLISSKNHMLLFRVEAHDIGQDVSRRNVLAHLLSAASGAHLSHSAEDVSYWITHPASEWTLTAIREIRQGSHVPDGENTMIVLHIDETSDLRGRGSLLGDLLRTLTDIQKECPDDTFLLFLMSGTDLDFMMEAARLKDDVTMLTLLQDEHCQIIVRDIARRCGISEADTVTLPPHVATLVRFAGGNPRFLARALVAVSLGEPACEAADLDTLTFSPQAFVHFWNTDPTSETPDWLSSTSELITRTVASGNKLRPEIIHAALIAYLLRQEGTRPRHILLNVPIHDLVKATDYVPGTELTWKTVAEFGLVSLLPVTNGELWSFHVSPPFFILYACMHALHDEVKSPHVLQSLLLMLSSAQNKPFDFEVITAKLQLLYYLEHTTVSLAQLVPGGDPSVVFTVPPPINVYHWTQRVHTSQAFIEAVSMPHGGLPHEGDAFQSGVQPSTGGAADAHLFLRLADEDQLWCLTIRSRRLMLAERPAASQLLPQVLEMSVSSELSEVHHIFKGTPWANKYAMI